MTTLNSSLNFDFSCVSILLVTDGTTRKSLGKHLEWRHPPDTIMIYMQACQAVSNQVYVISLDQLLDREFQYQFQSSPGLLVNIIGGLFDIELIGLPPSVARSLSMPCFPAGTKHYVTTHDKLLGKYLAHSVGLKTARTISGIDLDSFKGSVIQKPIYGGDSFSIKYFECWQSGKRPPVGSFVEEFILGADATLHFIRNSDGKSYTLIDHLITLGESTQWLDATTKESANRLYSNGKKLTNRQRYLDGISDELQTKLCDLMALSGYPFIGRIDIRQLNSQGKITSDDLIFLELNVAPTISNANDWSKGIMEKYGDKVEFTRIFNLPIHPAAKSLAIMLHEFYAQSLSMHGKSPVRAENLPN